MMAVWLEKLEQQILCGLCNEIYSLPKELSCGHSFCCTCLNDVASPNSTCERQCPLCSSTGQTNEIRVPQSGSFASEPPDSRSERLVEIFTEFRQKHTEGKDGPRCRGCKEPQGPPVDYCFECDHLLCQRCHVQHGNLNIFNGHRVERLEDLRLVDLARKRKIFCKTAGHATEKPVVEYFCEQCAKCICRECASPGGEHVNHVGVKSLGGAVLDAKETIRDILGIANSRVEELRKELQKIRQCKGGDLEGQFLACKEAVTRHALLCRADATKDRQKKEYIDRIDNRRDYLLEQLESECKLPKRLLEDQIKRISQHVNELSNCIASAEALIENDFAVDIVEKKTAFLDRLMQRTEKEIDTRPAAALKVTFDPYPLPENRLDSRKDQASDHEIGEMTVQLSRPSQSTADGNGLIRAFDGLQAQFVVTRKNDDGIKEAYYPDEDRPRVTFSSAEEDALPWEVKITDHQNGQYGVAYFAKDPGSYNINITIKGEQIYKSPFALQVRPREFKCEKVIGGYGTEDGLFKAPWGVAVSSTDVIAVSDQHNHRVQFFNRDGRFLKAIGGYGTEEGKFDCPFGLTYDGGDNLLVVDSNNSRVQKFDREGKFEKQFGKKGGGDGDLNLPWSVSTDADNGNIIVSDKGNNRVQIFSSEGEYLAQFGGTGDEPLSFPIACVMYNDHYFVSDTNNHCVKIFTKEGAYVSKFGEEGQGEGQLIKNQGLLMDKADNIVVCDSWNDRIQLFKLNADLLSVRSCKQFGSTGNHEGCLNDPSFLAMLRDGRFVVCDYRNHRVQIIA